MQWFVDMGSHEISKVKFQKGFAFVGIYGSKSMREKRSIRIKDQVSVSRIFKYKNLNSEKDEDHNYDSDS